MSDRATLRRLLREHAEAVSTEIAFIKEDAILRLFDATQSEHDAQVAALQAELTRAIDIYKDPAVAHANILNGRIVLPKFYVNITDDFGPVAGLRAALDAANARAEAAENVINAAHAVLARQVAEPHTSRGDTNAMVEAITILETVTLKGGEG